MIHNEGELKMEMNKTKTTTYELVLMAIMASIMCLLGPLALPIGLVPVSLTNLVIYFAVYLLGTKKGTISYIVYLTLGIFGLPVFSKGASGLAQLVGPTGGYLFGFIFMALICGVVIEKSNYKFIPCMIGMIVATIVDYMMGTVWFCIQQDCGIGYALGVCVFPFIIGDITKMALAACICPVIRKQMSRANLL